MTEKSGARPESPAAKIAVAVVIALVAGGSAPWWWDRLFPGAENVAATTGPKGSALPPECSPDVLRSQLLHAGSDRPAVIESSARTMREKYARQDFNCISGLAAVLLETDPDNGHGLYFTGEAWRVRAKLEPARAGFFRERMREFFFRYLDGESRQPPGERDGDAVACYKREKGYCAERTAWISHLMAIDYYQQAQDTADMETRTHHLQRALKFMDNDLKFGGFDQIVPSPVLNRKVRDELQSLAAPSGGTR